MREELQIEKYNITVECNYERTFRDIEAKSLEEAKSIALDLNTDYGLSTERLNDRNIEVYEEANKEIDYHRSIKVSKKFFETLISKIDKRKYRLQLEMFNYHREQGYVGWIYNLIGDLYKDLYIWVFESRVSDDIIVVLGDITNKDSNNMFDEEAFESAKTFQNNCYEEACIYVLDEINKKFNKGETINKR